MVAPFSSRQIVRCFVLPVSAFSLIEMVLVMLLLTMLALMAAPRFASFQAQQRVDAAARQTQLRDIFARAVAPPTGVTSAGSARASEETVPIVQSGAHALRSRRLQAVFDDDDAGLAVIDGIWVRVDEELSGCRMLRIEGTKAHFDCGSESVVLELAPSESNAPH